MSNSSAPSCDSMNYQQVNSNPAPLINHSQQFRAMPLNQSNVSGLKQDANSNNPHYVSSTVTSPLMGSVPNVNYGQSLNSSPAFNSSTMIQPQPGNLQASPHRPPPSSMPTSSSYQYTNNPQSVPFSSGNKINLPNSNIPSMPYGMNQSGFSSNMPPQQLGQINSNAPPHASSTSSAQPLVNGPPIIQQSTSLQSQAIRTLPPNSMVNVSNGSDGSQPSRQQGFVNNYISSSGSIHAESSMKPINVPSSVGPSISSYPGGPTGQIKTTCSNNMVVSQSNNFMGSQNNVPLNAIQSGPQVSGSLSTPFHSIRQSINPSPSTVYNTANTNPLANTSVRPPINSPPMNNSPSINSPPMNSPPMNSPPMNSPPMNSLPMNSPPMNLPAHTSSIPMSNAMQQVSNKTPMGVMSGPMRPMMPVGGPMNPQLNMTTSANLPNIGRPIENSVLSSSVNNQPPIATTLPNIQQTTRYPSSSQQQRYPTNMPPSPYVNHQPQQPQMANVSRQYPGQYNTQDITQRMGQLSVTKQGFDQLWGHQMVDLLQCKHVLPEYPEDPPEIKLGPHFTDAPNCSPEIFRCTINRIPETNSLLQKSRLPLGILIHPFKDLNHLPVIQCNTIVRCRSCRTYINPFVYFVDSKRWKCNLCYRVNDLPEEFQYDPVSKSYGDPSRRPEIRSATIEFIAPGEYMLRPPQPAVYLFLLDVSQIARESGYLEIFCETLKENLNQLPGDARMQVGFICYDAHIHYYLMSDGLTRPKEMTVLDIDDVFLPSPESLLVNLNERYELVMELLSVLPKRHSGMTAPASALGAALQAGFKLMAPTGGRITVFQTCLPNVGPGALLPREDPNARSSKDVAHLNPATDFYKRLALDCSGAQVAVDLFLLNSQYSDLATLSGMSKFSAGTVYHIPLFKASRSWQADQLKRMLTRYLTRKIGFEAVMRVRCTRGITIHTFHGNFFVRSTDLLSLPNVSPDAGFGMQLTIEESLSDVQQVCFQAALLYTSSKGERRIRVHTLALPIANTLPDVLHNADQQCIIGLLAKMAVDRCASASMSEAREALMNVAVDALSAHRLAQNLPVGERSTGLFAPGSLKLLPLYLLALLKRRAFRTGTSTRLDDRVADMCDMKTLPLSQVLRAVYPDLYPIHSLAEHMPPPAEEKAGAEEEDNAPDPPRLHLSAERVNSTGAYLLDDGETMILYIGHLVTPAFLSETFGVTSFNQIQDEARSLPKLDSEGNTLLHAFIERLNDERPYPSNILVLRDNSPSKQLFTERLVDDRVESAFAYYEFLQHIKSQVK